MDFCAVMRPRRGSAKSFAANAPSDTALRLASFFDNSPEFGLNLQLMHDLSAARLELSKTIERNVEAYAGA